MFRVTFPFAPVADSVTEYDKGPKLPLKVLLLVAAVPTYCPAPRFYRFTKSSCKAAALALAAWNP